MSWGGDAKLCVSSGVRAGDATELLSGSVGALTKFDVC